MTEKNGHLTDEELLLLADGELGSRQATDARRHLFSCWECRTRMSDIEASVNEFIHLHHATLDSRIPPIDGPRRVLKAQLSKLANESTRRSWWEGWHFGFAAAKTVCAVIVLFTFSFIAGIAWRHSTSWQLPGSAYSVSSSSLPDRRLTPGNFQPVRLQDVCEARPYEQARVTSISLKQQVLREYGMPGAAASDHEIDFLVIPELGGTEDIQNLWPEPYSSTVWNAHVKDELEERLHQLVCERKIDLKTAQYAIATDWISAYKKYFHTNKPVLYGSNS